VGGGGARFEGLRLVVYWGLPEETRRDPKKRDPKKRDPEEKRSRRQKIAKIFAFRQ